MLVGLLVLLAAGVAGLGYYLDWFHISRGSADDETKITITVDQDKIRQGKKKVQEKVQDLSRKGKETNGKPADQAKEQGPNH
jgi:hypothetical protein